MGVVYLAHDEALLRPTAVKLLSWQANDVSGQNPEAWFLAEARSVARVNHPNVVQIYGVARQGSTCYIAMEYVAGGSVDTLVAKRGPLSAARATALLIECASALQAAHDVGIVHRDVKPENLLISADGSAKLGDFGMALRMAAARPNEPARAGTPFYTAPEIWQGQAASPATDLYALGATYFFMLTGRVPFVTHDLPSLIQAHLHAEVPDASAYSSKVPKPCDLLLRKCLAKSPRERFASARALAAESQTLLAALDDASTSTNPSFGAISVSRYQVYRVPSEKPVSAVEGLNLRARQSLILEDWVRSVDSRILLVFGDPGCGHTTLLDRLVDSCTGTRVIVHFDGVSATISDPGLLPAKGKREYSQTSGTRARVGVLRGTDWRSIMEHAGTSPILFVLDTTEFGFASCSSLLTELRRREDLQFWKIIVAASFAEKTRWNDLANGASEFGLRTCEVRPLSLQDALNFVALRLAGHPELLVTPDARLLIAHCGLGNPGRTGALLEDLVSMARASQTRLLTTWEVWAIHCASPDAAEELDATESEHPTRPGTWPTPRVLEILNQCRKQCGIPPRPSVTAV
jgi:serine/threonine protein kinase